MNSTNYYEYMKELQTLEAQKRELLRKKHQKDLQDKLKQVESLKRSLHTCLANIKQSSDYINTNSEQIAFKLASTSQDFIRMNRKTAKYVQSLDNSIREIYAHSTYSNCDLISDNQETNEMLAALTEDYNNAVQLHNNCFAVYKNVCRLKNSSATEESLLGSSKKQKSILSESSYINTFHPQNVSSSSPIHLKKSPKCKRKILHSSFNNENVIP